MGVMAWSSTSMAARYQPVIDPIRWDMAARMGDLLWLPDADGNAASERHADGN